MLDSGKKTCSILLVVRMVCFFFCWLCSLDYNEIAQRNAVPVDGALDGEEGPLDGRLSKDADIAVARAAPLATEGNRDVFLFLFVGAAPGQLHPVQIGLGWHGAFRRIKNLIRERVHLERERESAGHFVTQTFKFTKKRFFLFFYWKDKLCNDMKTEVRLRNIQDSNIHRSHNLRQSVG